MNTQYSIFDVLYPKYKITKPIRLIEMFSGYGSQALALKYLGVPFEHWKICEWAIKSIQAYKDIHFTNDNTDYSKLHSKDSLIKRLYEIGISNNYNEPMTLEQIKRLSESQIRIIYNNIRATHNLVNIQQVKGFDLEICETDKYNYILTYSFPCQDLSLAGKGKGMSDTSTRSGMLWEVERILTECYELKTLPQILLMENVPQVHGEGNTEDFNKWQLRLEELGYKNYWQDLIATDYGIPQTRNRCFMISILGDYSYTFPKPIPLKLKLKDMLEDNVDEKYYLSEKGIQYICGNALNKDLKDRIDRSKTKLSKEIAYTISTKQDRRCGDANFILDGYGETTIEEFLKIKNKSLKETLEQNNIDDTCYIDAYNKRIDKEKSGTITTGVSFRNNTFIAQPNMKTQLCNDLILKRKVKENDVIRHSYSNSRMKDWETRSVEQNNISPTLDTRCDCLGVVNNMRIRKLTPKECFRLMGVKDEDYEKVAKNQSNASLYHLAGDSIVVNVLMAILKELL